MKIWVKYGNKKAKIELEGCQDVADLRKKIREEPDLRIPKEHSIILKWKNVGELEPETKLSQVRNSIILLHVRLM